MTAPEDLNKSIYSYNNGNDGDNDDTYDEYQEEYDRVVLAPVRPVWYGDLHWLNQKQCRSFKNGVLDGNIIAKNLSNLGRSADGTKFLYLDLKADGLGINEISELAKFKELQNLNLAKNQLKGEPQKRQMS
jgi:hypothetical protein